MRKFIWAAYGMYFLGGMTAVLFGSVMQQLLQHYHISYASGGFIVLLGAIGFMSGVPLVTYLMSRFHYRYILAGSAAAVAIAQLVMLLLPPIGWLYGLVILSGFGASALETAVASYVMETFVGQRAVFMSRLEVSFGLGALSMPVIASMFIALDMWRLTFFVIGGFALFLSIVWLSISFSLQAVDGISQLDAVTSAPPEFATRRSKYKILSFFLFIILLYVGLEGSLNSFLPSIFSVRFHTPPYYASLSSSMLWIAMVAGRVAIGWVARRVNYEQYLLGSIIGTLLFLTGLSQIHHGWTGFVIVFGLGFAMSAIYSITMVYANHTFPGMERAVTSLVTAFAGVGGAIFPALTGYAMDRLQPEHVLWLLVGYTVVLLSILLMIFIGLHTLRRENGDSVHSSETPKPSAAGPK